MSFIERVWYGTSVGDRIVRAALAPASWLYGLGVAARRVEEHASALPALSIGNVTVGGTGKTPIAAWAVRRLTERGASPSIVMRGYGGDEPEVHRILNPSAGVVTDTDRVRGVERAKRDGADCVVLDDAFQHRRIARVSDWVLIAAEQWREHLRLLPAGPLREPLAALRRASVLVVTRKDASQATGDAVRAALEKRFPGVPVAACHLRLGEVVDARSGHRLPLEWVRGRRIAVASGIGNPAAFHSQLRAVDAEIHPISFGDHHAFTASDVARLVAAADRTEGLVCTLKDAVKLASRWPAAAPPLWYVSQSVAVEIGADVLDRALEAVLAARHPAD